MIVAAVCLFVIAVAVYAHFVHGPPGAAPPDPSGSTPPTPPERLDCTELNTSLWAIDGSNLPDHCQDQLAGQVARPAANHTLQEVFGIDNAFTTDEAGDIQHFVTKVKNLIDLSPDEWDDLGSFIRLAVRRAVNVKVGNKNEVRIKLALMIRTLTLRAVIWVLLRLGRDKCNAVDDSHFERLGDTIHRAWINMEAGDAVEFKDNHDLQKQLAEFFGDDCILNPKDSPLNLILPGFEGFWWIVLREYIEMEARGSQNLKEIMIAFAQSPTQGRFKVPASPDDISAEFIVREALRLYPPSRRIHRAFLFSESAQPTAVPADIEACQTDPAIWGPDSLEFNPRRWTNATKEQQSSFLAFGSASFQCHAYPGFEPRITGLLVGILLDEFQIGCTLVSDDAEEMSDLCSVGRLRNDRDSFYEGVYLVRKVIQAQGLGLSS
ncbi:hypothetical protein BJX61DRAFT_538479 [Aspergillus egyptiacus]|nr:hypothetical protein BJX61DRAFT_538479 [Aspergillus egyptiacus]